jgi:hypothetical protein
MCNDGERYLQELADLLGVSRAIQIAWENADFPKPSVELAGGRV